MGNLYIVLGCLIASAQLIFDNPVHAFFSLGVLLIFALVSISEGMKGC